MDRFKSLKMGMQSYTLRNFDTADVIENVAELGLSHIEFCGVHIKPGDGEATDDAMAMCRDKGLGLLAYGVVPLKGDEAADRAFFEYGKQIGIEVLSANPEPEAMPAVSKLAEEYGLKVGIHNHGPTSLWPDRAKLEQYLTDDISPLVGLCVDTGHFTRVPQDPIEIMQVFKDRVHSVHLKDIDIDQNGEHGQEHIIGDGPLDLQAVLDLLMDWKFDGPISIEYELKPEDPMDDLRVALDRVEKALA